MAKADQVELLKRSVRDWNAWRETHRSLPDLREANLKNRILPGANLQGANLRGAVLQGANLRGANLQRAHLTRANLKAANLLKADLYRADLEEADLKEADLQGANLKMANFKGALLTDANICSVGIPGRVNVARVDLSEVGGLSQLQLDQMIGDTGVILPPGLIYPRNWPTWDGIPPDSAFSNGTGTDAPEVGSENSRDATTSPFVFLSYANEDLETVERIKSLLLEEKIVCWWDQQVAPGEMWRERVAEKLTSAAVVLASWSKHSCASVSVKEEATAAQNQRKLVHCRLDETSLPYGFAETQYQDLTDWNGSLDHKGFRRLVRAIRDKINPPSRATIEERLGFTAQVSAIELDGKISAKDSPPDVDPPVHHPEDLEQRLKAQAVLCDKICDQLDGDEFPNNLDKTVLYSVRHYGNWVRVRPASWYTLVNAAGSIQDCIRDFSDEAWPGTTEGDAKRLCFNNDELRPYLQPVQPDVGKDERADPPDINPDHVSERALKSVVLDTETMLADSETDKVLDESATNAFVYYKDELSASADQTASGEREERLRYRRLRLGIIGLAGFISTILAGVSINLLTAPAAAKTLMLSLRAILDKLLGFF